VLNTNPAGIALLRGEALDVFVEVANSRQRHADSFGNDNGVSNEFIGLGGFGWTRPIAGTELVAGIGLFGQGGAGFVHRGLATAFGTRDSTALVFGIGRLTPALGWRVNERLSLGFALPITLARAKQEFFPRTSVFTGDAATSFFGLDITGLQARRVSVRLGARYQATPTLTLGCSWPPSLGQFSASVAQRMRSVTTADTSPSVCGSTARNSSPPTRPKQSVLRRLPVIAVANACSTSSPAAWPKRSLICLK